NDITNDDFSPRVAVNYLVNDHSSLRLVLSRATRTPVLIEEMTRQIYVADLPQPIGSIEVPIYIARGGLDSEVIDSAEVGYHHEWREYHASVDAKLFQNRLRGLIRDSVRDDLPLNPLGREIRSFENREDIRLTGIEFQADARPRSWLRVYATASLVATDADDPRRRFEDSVPDRTLSVGVIAQPRRNVTIAADYYRHAKYKWLDGNWLDDGNGFLDLTLSTRFGGNSLGSGQIIAQLALRDLLADDEPYPEGINRRETNVYFKAGMEF
ncbi:MAG: TonB-dependent receptor, partial [Chromatiales bacterium]|nr:TonB-dependent receptor [Chromatiales bacterium]